MARKALIMGGGIGGLTSAIALQRAGFEVSVFERAPVITAIGAGITLTQSTQRGLYSLGLRDAVAAAADDPDQGDGGARRRAGMFGRDDVPPPADNLPFFLQIHRADLYEILRTAVLAADPNAIHLDHEFARYEQDDKGVTAYFKNGAAASGDLLIGADGVRSAVRTHMRGPEDPRFTGQVVYRCLIPTEAVSQYLEDGDAYTYLGPGRLVLRYLIRHRTVVNVVAFVTTDSWKGEGFSEPTTPEELLSLFPGWDEKVLGLFRNAPPEDTAKWAIYDRDPIPCWSDGRVTLLGDAAHPMLPFLGLGAAMAIEDAVVLGRAVKQASTIAQALSLYEGARRERANWVLLQSRLQGEMNQIDAKERPPRRQQPAGDPILYDYDPSKVALGLEHSVVA
jgi:salicylate hydroxylase